MLLSQIVNFSLVENFLFAMRFFKGPTFTTSLLIMSKHTPIISRYTKHYNK